jgi:hypothetical protein
MLIPALCREHVTPEMFFTTQALPSPTSARAFTPLFGWFTGTMAQCDFSTTYTSALRFMAFTDRSSSADEGVLEISRFSCMLFLSVRGLYRLRRTKQPLAYNAAAVLPSSYSTWSQHPDLPAFRSSITPPTNASVLRFKRHLTMTPARLEVRMESLVPFL